jgi:ABC-type nickel/cobalt efflux system permease component RcnA
MLLRAIPSRRILVRTQPGSRLSNPNFHDRYLTPTNRSSPLLRLMGTIIVALLAITMAILPISGPQGAAQAAHQHAVVTTAGHAHGEADGNHSHADLQVSLDTGTLGISGDHDSDTHDCTGVICCSMGTCHAFQITAPAYLYAPAVSQVSMVMTRDEQVEDIIIGGLDRPPRTI